MLVRALLVALGVSALCALVFRDRRRGALPASALLLVGLGYGHAVALLPAGIPPEPAVLGGGALLVLVALLVAWRAGRGRIDAITRGLDIVAAILVALALINVGPRSMELLFRSPPPLADRPAPVAGDRDIWLLVLDRHGSTRSLATLGGIEPRLPGLLAERGFAMAADARANYDRTTLALASLLGMDYLDPIVERMGPQSSDESPLVDAIRDHAVGRRLRERGYELIQLGSWFLPTASSAIADRVEGATTQPDFERLFQETTILALTETVLETEIFHNDRQHRETALHQLATLEDLRTERAARPRFIFAHLLLPHPPYVFRADGAYPTEEERKRPGPEQYEDQLRFTETQLTGFLDRLLAVPAAERPIVIVAADEGPYPKRLEDEMGAFDWRGATDEELLIKFGTLLAIHLPTPGEPVVGERMTPVNIFRLVFDRAFGTELGLLPDRTFRSRDGSHPYDQDEITERLDAIDATRPFPSPAG